jgi:hypothetical protein
MPNFSKKCFKTKKFANPALFFMGCWKCHLHFANFVKICSNKMYQNEEICKFSPDFHGNCQNCHLDFVEISSKYLIRQKKLSKRKNLQILPVFHGNCRNCHLGFAQILFKCLILQKKNVSKRINLQVQPLFPWELPEPSP